MKKSCCLFGSGIMGVPRFSTLLASTSDEVIIWSREADVAESINKEHVNCRHLSDSELPHNIVSTTSRAEALTGVDAVVMAAPSAFLRSVCAACAPYLDPEVDVLILSKGMEAGSHKLMHEVAADELGTLQESPFFPVQTTQKRSLSRESLQLL